MPVQKITAQSFDQYCAGCSQTNTIDLATIELGISDQGGQRKSKNIIRLPACPNCGSIENLIRTWDDASEVTPPGHQIDHRKAVNRLAQMLKSQGRVNADCAPDIDAETGEPPNIHPDTPTAPEDEIDIGPPHWASTGEGGG